MQASVKDLDLGYLLDKARVTVRENLPKIEIGSVSVNEMKQGDTIELTKWIADILNEMRFAESQEESFEGEMFKALSRERIQGPTQLSTLEKDFFIRMRRFLQLTKRKAEENPSLKQNYERVAVSAYDLVALRTSKLIALSTSSSPPADLPDKITPEEKILFDAAFNLVSKWRDAVLGGARS